MAEKPKDDQKKETEVEPEDQNIGSKEGQNDPKENPEEEEDQKENPEEEEDQKEEAPLALCNLVAGGMSLGEAKKKLGMK